MLSEVTTRATSSDNRLVPCSVLRAGAPYKTYKVETSETLLSNQWSDIGSPVTATATMSALTVPLAPADERRFYRIRVLP